MIVETTRLSRRFGGRSAVDQVSLALPEGAAMMLVGANGAGKSTLLRLSSAIRLVANTLQ